MAAPGMAMAAVGPRAWAAGETARMPRFYLDLKRHRDTAVGGRDAVDAGRRGAVPGGRGPAADAGRGRRRVRPPRGVRGDERGPACGRSASSCSPTTTSPRRRSPRPGSRTASTGRRSTARSSAAASCSPAARASSRARSSGSGHLGSVTTDDILAAIGVLEAAAIERGLDVRPGVGRRGGPAGARRGPASARSREDPRRRAARGRGARPPAPPPRGRRAART